MSAMSCEGASRTGKGLRTEGGEKAPVSWDDLEKGVRFEVERMGFRPQSKRILEVLLRGSFGCGLREVHVWSLDWFVSRTGLDIGNVSRELGWLVEAGVLYCRELGAGPEGERKRGYGFELDADLWDVNGRLSRERALELWRSAGSARGAGVQEELPPADLPGALRSVMEELAMDRLLSTARAPLTGTGPGVKEKKSGERVVSTDGVAQPFSSEEPPKGGTTCRGGFDRKALDRAIEGDDGFVDSTIVDFTNGEKGPGNWGFVDSTNHHLNGSELLNGLNGSVQSSKASELLNGVLAGPATQAESKPPKGGTTCRAGIDLRAEREFLEALGLVLDGEQMDRFGRWWRVVFRDCPGACWAALRDVEGRLKEGFPVRHPGAYMRDLFLRFRKGRKGFVPREELERERL